MVAVWQAAPMKRLVPLVMGAAAVLLLGACSGGDDGAEGEKPADLVARAGTTLAATDSVHFTVTSADVPDDATALLGGEGDAARPDQFKGDLDVRLFGAEVTVPVVSVGGTLYAKLPFAADYTTVDPGQVGISDPGALLAADGGVTSLLADATDAADAGETRIGEVVAKQVTATIPGATVASVLTTVDPAADFDATFAIDPDTGQLLQAVLSGPFYDAATDSTYTIQLSAFDEPVEITAPV
jgi:lipoprotein LprG